MNLNPIFKKLLNNRGITSEEDIIEFLSDKPQKTYDPFLLPHMEAGVDLILSEIAKGTKICIYGDYDADGITSTTILMSVLGKLTDPSNLSYYIPSRFDEGYGLNKDAITTIAETGCSMIITVDCGSVSYDEVEYAKSLGLKVVITDHHTITDKMADCILINPKHPDSVYPFKDLAGCGVAFKLCQALQKRSQLPKSVLTEVLDLVAVGTIGDIMPLVDENRTLVKFGLKVLNLGRRSGLERLIRETSLKPGTITSENISYVIVPHLNASGRIQDAGQAVELLLGEADESREKEIVSDLIAKNALRKKLQNQLFMQCASAIDKDSPDDIIIINCENAHEGIAGIVAGKLKETYYRPAIIVTKTGSDGSQLKGTGRSIEGVNLYELLKTQENLFDKFGGHAGACGFSLKAENYDGLCEGLRNEMKRIAESNPEIFTKKYNVELELATCDLTAELADQMELLAPFGNKNPKPLIQLSGVSISEIKHMGNEGQHMRFAANNDACPKVQCVMFGKAKDFDESCLHRRRETLIGVLEAQVWQGIKRLQFLVDEIQFDEKEG